MSQPTSESTKGFSIRALAAGEVEIILYEEIGYWGVDAKRFRDELKAAGPVTKIHLRINSPGGNVFDGLAIYNTLVQHAARVVVHVDGVALSMASVVAMAGDEIEAAENAFVMIHNPMNIVAGDAEDLRSMAELLDKVKSQLVGIYAARTKLAAEKIAEMMDAETWLSGAECVEQGFADRTYPALAVAASFEYDLSRFGRVPQAITERMQAQNASSLIPPTLPPTPEPNMAESTTQPTVPTAASYAELKAGCVGADAGFLCAQMEASATLAQAQASWMAEQAKRIEAAHKEAAEATAAAEAAKQATKTPGVDALGNGGKQSGSEGSGDAIAEWNEALTAKEAVMKNRGRAIAALVREQPELHQRYIAAYNAQVRARQ